MGNSAESATSGVYAPFTQQEMCIRFECARKVSFSGFERKHPKRRPILAALLRTMCATKALNYGCPVHSHGWALRRGWRVTVRWVAYSCRLTVQP